MSAVGWQAAGTERSVEPELPVESAPTAEPAPVEPGPVEPGSVQPGSVQPGSVQLGSVQTRSVQPRPIGLEMPVGPEPLAGYGLPVGSAWFGAALVEAALVGGGLLVRATLRQPAAELGLHAGSSRRKSEGNADEASGPRWNSSARSCWSEKCWGLSASEKRGTSR
jgi:hypothetical protein